MKIKIKNILATLLVIVTSLFIFFIYICFITDYNEKIYFDAVNKSLIENTIKEINNTSDSGCESNCTEIL